MNVQTRPLPASPLWVLTPQHKRDLELLALSATLFPVAISLLLRIEYKKILDLPPAAHLFTTLYISILSVFGLGSGLLLSVIPLTFAFKNWEQVAQELPTEELLPYLNGAHQLGEEEHPRFEALIDALARQPRFSECMGQINSAARLRIWLLLPEERRREAPLGVFLSVCDSLSSREDLYDFLGSLTREQGAQFLLLIIEALAELPQREDPLPPMPQIAPAAAAA